MRFLHRAVFITAAISFLLGCDSSLGFLGKPYSDQYYSVSVSAAAEGDSDGVPVEPGSVLIPGAPFTVAVDPLPGSSPITRVVVSFIAQEAAVAQAVFALAGTSDPKGMGNLISAKTEVPALDGIPLSIMVPEGMAQGLYRLRIDLYDSDGSVYGKDNLVFVSTAAMSVASVQVSPGSVEPGSVAVLRAQLELSNGIDPYLVWIHDDRIVDQGLLSDGKANVAWKAPDEEGVYTLSLRAYPYAPRNGQSFDFPGVAGLSARVIVRAAEPDPSDPFQPNRDFYAQFRFNGSLADSGSRHSRAASRAEGSPGIFVYGPGYGVRFGPAASLATEEYLLPVEDGILKPFSIMARLLPLPNGAEDELPVALIASLRAPSSSYASAGFLANEVGDGGSSGAGSSATDAESSTALDLIKAEADAGARESGLGPRARGVIFRSESVVPGFGLSLAISDEGQLVLSVSNRTERAVFESGIFPDERIHDLAVSVTPTEGGVAVSWFWDYKPAASGRVSISIGPIPGEGRASFGGDGAAEVVIDEFAVYSREIDGTRQPWTGAFATMARRAMRRGFVYADGFEGAGKPETGVDGDAALDDGALLLGAGASLSIPVPSASRGAYDLVVAFRVMADSLRNRSFSLIARQGGREAFRMGQDGRCTSGGAELGRLPGILNGQSLRVRIVKDAKGYALSSGSVRVQLPVDSGSELDFFLSSGKTVLPVESLLIASGADAVNAR